MSCGFIFLLFNFLGLSLDDNTTQLTWICHINKLSNKISQCMGILNRLSHLNLAMLLWGFKCDNVFKLPKKIARILSLSKYNAHTDCFFKNSKLFKENDILNVHELKFYYKYKNNKLPYYLKMLPFHADTKTHGHDTYIKYNMHHSVGKYVFC